MLFGLKDDTINKIKNVFSLFPQIKEVIIYGSRAKGNYRPGSDIDLAVKGKNLNLRILNQVSLKLDDLYLPYTFDLSIISQIENPELIKHISRNGKILYKQELAEIVK